MRSEQEEEGSVAISRFGRADQRPDPTAWGQPITEDRKAELDDLAAQQERWVEQATGIRGASVFTGIRLTGADVFWLAIRALTRRKVAPMSLEEADHHLRAIDPAFADRMRLNLFTLHLEGADLHDANLEMANLSRVWMTRTNLSGARLTHADLTQAELTAADFRGASLQDMRLIQAHLVGADLRAALLVGADLTAANLAGADLSSAYLVDALLTSAHLEGANIVGANLTRVDASDASLEGAFLSNAILDGIILRAAELADSVLIGARLTAANCRNAHMARANLEGADLRGSVLIEADLTGSNLRGVAFDSGTNLTEAHLGPGSSADWLDGWIRRNRNAALGNIVWRDVDLTAVPWDKVRRLGDERIADSREKVVSYVDVVRAYRQVAQRLRDQGLLEEADRFSYRAQVRQRGVLLRTWRLPQYLFSWLLAILAGYGYRPGRTLCWYLLIVLGYAYAYLHVGPSVGVPLSPLGALVFSVTSFHGRGFFPGGSPGHSITLDDPLTVLAASEAIVGLLIEISFIATFTQRYFGAK